MKKILLSGFLLISLFAANEAMCQTVFISNYSSCGINYQLSDGTDSFITAGIASYSFTPAAVPTWGTFNNGCDLEFLTVGNPPSPATLTATNTFPCSCAYTVNWTFIPPSSVSITIF